MVSLATNKRLQRKRRPSRIQESLSLKQGNALVDIKKRPRQLE
ncbi:hypothetical protein HMPREF0973_00517 [Prevotella veroralis F0319]|uniref:Uncharacterized protein n=1 Tax=Prevotella veroralis F0319 TaxID=649761 RepID=C9MLP2_9BACT|nr:hypothetical protein HMPREF0973_00517 [Prevotella veroralis F0319]